MLADRVASDLQMGKDFEDTLNLVRVACKNFECTVSWNHLVDHLMGQGKISAALKVYNEVSAPRAG